MAHILEKARDYIYRNARLLDRKRFEYLFDGGSSEGIIDVLRTYQNEDGGFGNALEPDIRCPYSQPVPTEMALELMDKAETYDIDILKGIVRYLRQITLDNGGFPLVRHNAMEYPHAPWWVTERDDTPSINPTGSIIGLLWKQQAWTAFQEEQWFVNTVNYVWRTMEQSEPNGYHDGVQWISFLQHAPDRALATRYMDKLDAWLVKDGVIERNIQAEGYVHKVLDWAPTPEHYARRFVSDPEIEAHLDDLIEQQQDDGGWPISWPTVSPFVELEWRGYLTVERLATLRAYGRL